MKLTYDPWNEYFKSPFGAVSATSELTLRTGVTRRISVQEVYFVIVREGGSEQWIPGEWDSLRCSEDIYIFQWTAQESGLYFYRFEGIFRDGQRAVSDTFQLTVYDEGFQVPDWLASGLMYQIFPDRFARSKGYQAPLMNKNYVLREDWGGVPVSGPDENGIVQNNDFFGGNLAGITENLDYLQGLGVNILYLNPIFQAYSNHRYDTGCYMKVDPLLGTAEDFVTLCHEAAVRGIRVILDGVFNHTGSDSLYFNKEGHYDGVGAYQSSESPYYRWYNFTDYPNYYDCWWGINTLPSVNETDSDYLNYMLTGPDSVVRHWLRLGASGYRLDVADELPDQFLDLLRKVVKEERPDAVVIGEVWEDASNKISYSQRRRYLQGKQLDSVMNYPLKDGILRFFAGDGNAEALSDTVNTLWEHYPKQVFYSLMNSLGTHDTPRILTLLEGWENDLELGRQRLFAALLLWAFLPGVPCIYYGDENGMEGQRDPFNRGCFEPQKKQQEIFNYYERLLRFRSSIGELGSFKFEPGCSSGGLYLFNRVGPERVDREGCSASRRRLVLAVNAGSDSEECTVLLSDKEVILERFSCATVSESSGGVIPQSGSRRVNLFIPQYGGIAILIEEADR